jgi:TetR/AcrR family transcriptional regulator, transcriptional repressor for nem operon
MPRRSLRNQILDAGERVMTRSGYHGVGIREIMTEASAPLGSFANHFGSKEAFAAEVLDQYFERTKDLARQVLTDPDIRPKERLRGYFDLVTQLFADNEFAAGCLIGNLSIEVSSCSQALRERLASVFAEWREPFAACITEGQAAGEITETIGAYDLADFILTSWQGAVLRMRVDRSPEAFQRFKSVVFSMVL